MSNLLKNEQIVVNAIFVSSYYQFPALLHLTVTPMNLSFSPWSWIYNCCFLSRGAKIHIHNMALIAILQNMY